MIVRSSSTSLCACCLSFVMAGALAAQLPQAPMLDTFVSPEARLDMMEKTYATNLRPIHGPVMQDYLRELDLLKNKMTASGRATEAAAVEAEIARIRQAMATTGVFPYSISSDGASADPSKSPATEPPKPATEGAAARTALALQASRANGSTLAAGGAALLGSLDWTVEKLAAGTYDVAMVFACPPLDAPEQLSLSYAGSARSFNLPVERATGSEKNFRIFRLGTITVEREQAAGNLRLQSSSATSKILVRSVILSRSQSPPPATPN